MSINPTITQKHIKIFLSLLSVVCVNFCSFKRPSPLATHHGFSPCQSLVRVTSICVVSSNPEERPRLRLATQVGIVGIEPTISRPQTECLTPRPYPARAENRTRTCYLLFTKQLLIPMSFIGMAKVGGVEPPQRSFGDLLGPHLSPLEGYFFWWSITIDAV